MPGDIAAFEIVPASVCQDRILPAEKTAVTKCVSIPIEPDCQGLPYGTGGVFERNVLRRKVIRVDQRRSCAEGANRFAVRSSHPRVQTVSEYAFRRVLALQSEKTLLALDVNQFFVDSRLYVNDPGPVATARGRGVDRILHRFELPVAIGRDRRVGRRGPAAANQDGKRQQETCRKQESDSLGHPLCRGAIGMVNDPPQRHEGKEREEPVP